MKRIIALFAFFILLGSISLQAAPVSRSQALEIAKMVLAAQPATKSAGDVKFLWDGEDIATKSTLDPAFYVFGRDNGGFVIIAGNDNVRPILAISDHNTFEVENMPDNVKWWMERMKFWVREQKEATPEVQALWSKYIVTKGGRISGEVLNKVEHLTPEWGQGNPYNGKCPIDPSTSKQSLTGCVAAVLSEVLTTLSGLSPYNTFMATHATGTIEAYTVPTGYVSAETPYTLGTAYDWENLRKLETDNDVVTAQTASPSVIENLAQLMADMGAIMHAQYSSGSTGAVTQYADDYLSVYMGFNKGAYFEYAEDHTSSEWEALLKAQLVDHPLVYSGRRESGGHAFAFDGYGEYDGANVFHVNFGWSGNWNGYYYHTWLESSEGRYYQYQCGALFDFVPDPDPAHSTYPKRVGVQGAGLQYLYDDSGYGSNLVPVPSLGDGGDKFVVTGWIGNVGEDKYTGSLRLALKDKDGNPKDTCPGCEFECDPGYGDGCVYFENVSFSKSYAFGDYVEIEYSTNDTQTEWAPVLLYSDVSRTVCQLPVYPAAFIYTAPSYKPGAWFQLRLMNHDSPYDGTVWIIVEPDGNELIKKQSEYSHIVLTKTGQYKIRALVSPEDEGDVTEVLVANIVVN